VSARPAAESECLVIQTAHLGDLVFTLPLLTRLAEQHGPVDLLTTPTAAPLAETHPGVHSVIRFDKHQSDRGPRALLRLARQLRAARYARVVLPHESVRSAALAWASGARERTGFAGAPGAFLYTARTRRPAVGHRSQRLLALAGGGSLPPQPWLRLSPSDRERASAFLDERGVHGAYLVLAPGARWGTKRWPHYPDLAARLTYPIVIVGGPEDAAAAEHIAARAAGGGHSAAGRCTIRESAALLERAAVVVANDSVALHLASSLGRPAVALFGPTSPTFGVGPAGRDDQVVELSGLACRPCSPHGPPVCPLGHHRCMRDLGVDLVLQAIQTRLDLAP
jgi:lipopolysaccharide heptosyltransferase II